MNMKSFVCITKALSDSHRVRAALALRSGELCACQIIELLKLAPSTVSSHMSILIQSGLVESRKDGRWVYYSLADTSKSADETGRLITLCISLLEKEASTKADERTMGEITKIGQEELCKQQRS
jgi:ArsR family transcriptional regulator